MSIFSDIAQDAESVGETIANGAEQAASSVAANAESLGSSVADGNIQGAVEAGGELLADAAEAGAVVGA